MRSYQHGNARATTDATDKTGVTEQQQHEKSQEKSPTNKIDDDMEFTQANDQFTAAIELNRSNYTLYI